MWKEAFIPSICSPHIDRQPAPLPLAPPPAHTRPPPEHNQRREASMGDERKPHHWRPSSPSPARGKEGEEGGRVGRGRRVGEWGGEEGGRVGRGRRVGTLIHIYMYCSWKHTCTHTLTHTPVQPHTLTCTTTAIFRSTVDKPHSILWLITRSEKQEHQHLLTHSNTLSNPLWKRKVSN